jgi:hypothetical protein
MDSVHFSVRMEALMRIRNEKLLCKIGKRVKELRLRLWCISKVSKVNWLKKIAINDGREEVIKAVETRLFQISSES